MTRQQQNDIIIQHLSAELADLPDISRRVGLAFNRWFQSLVAPPPAPEQPPQEEVSQ